MKASELIKELQEKIELYDDFEVVYIDQFKDFEKVENIIVLDNKNQTWGSAYSGNPAKFRIA